MAKRHPAARHRRPEKPVDEDDVFVAKVFEFSVWARDHSQTLILIGVALAILAGGGIYYLNYRSNLEAQAMIELERIQQTLATGDTEGAETQLSGYLGRFGGSRHATEARLLLGQVHLATGEPEVAIQVLSEGTSPRDPLAVQVGTLLAQAYEEVGRLDDAEQRYLDVADAARFDFQRREALAGAARLRSLRDDNAGAAELYRQILATLDEDAPADVRGEYEMRLSEAERALNG